MEVIRLNLCFWDNKHKELLQHIDCFFPPASRLFFINWHSLVQNLEVQRQVEGELTIYRQFLLADGLGTCQPGQSALA